MSSIRTARAGVVDSATSPWLRAATAVVTLNVIFILSLLWQAALPTELLRERVRQAFASGELIQEDWLRWDSRRGYNQYNDCLILQMMINRDRLLPKAFGPVLYVKDKTWTDYCQTLYDLTQGDVNSASYISMRYTRYWHGYLPISAALLQTTDLDDIRRALKLTVYGALVLLVVTAGRRHRGLLAVVAIVAITGALFWALPYYGQSLCHGPGDAFVILGIAGLLFWRKWLSRPETFIPFCAAYGAVIVYLEFLTGLLPTAAGLLFLFGYLIARLRPEGETSASRDVLFAFIGLGAFALAGLMTVALKQVLSLVLADDGALSAFAGNFSYYTTITDDVRFGMQSRYPYVPRWVFEHPISVVSVPLGSLLRNVYVLTYDNRSAGRLLVAATAFAWLAAAFLAMTRKQRRLQIDFLAFAIGAAIVLAWPVVFPTHTFIHSFMARILIVPIALGWAALTWQLLAGRELRGGAPRWERRSERLA